MDRDVAIILLFITMILLFSGIHNTIVSWPTIIDYITVSIAHKFQLIQLEYLHRQSFGQDKCSLQSCQLLEQEVVL